MLTLTAIRLHPPRAVGHEMVQRLLVRRALQPGGHPLDRLAPPVDQ
jgi:hypothetical protein